MSARSDGTARAVLIGLVVITLALYSQVRWFDFVNYDDPENVSANAHVQAGLTPASIGWAFRSAQAANWLPMTGLSYLLDAQLFGVKASWFHLINVLLHALAAALLFAFLNRSTHSLWPSAWVAAIFALHPLHVESVAWISERKDVLSAFFATLALWCYAGYAARPSARRYLAVCLALVFGLLSKPMLVTLPFVFLLLDFWPLRRLSALSRQEVWPLLREKVPLFVLSAAAACATYLVQQASGAIQTFEVFPFALRLENALLSYVCYAWETVWPAGLAVFYPYPSAIPAWEAAIAALALAAVSIAVVRAMATRPYLAAGWFWYLGMLVPVIGLVQAGAQAHADRYMYLPMVGLTVMLAWTVSDLLRRAPQLRPVAVVLAAGSCAACAAITWQQTGYWRDSTALFRHAIQVTDNNSLAHLNLGVALAANPDTVADAISEYHAALAIRPDYALAHTDLGTALAKMPGGLPAAITQFHEAIALEPSLSGPHMNLARAFADSGRWNEAIGEYATALRLDPDNSDARQDLAEAQDRLAMALAKEGHPSEAIPHFEAELRLRPDSAEAHNNLGVVLTQLPGRATEALAQFQSAVQLDPNYPDAQLNLGLALSAVPGRETEAIEHLEAADRLHPDPEVRRAIEELKAPRK